MVSFHADPLLWCVTTNHLNECAFIPRKTKQRKTATWLHFWSCLSAIWKAWLTTETASRLPCAQKPPIFLFKIFFWVPDKIKYTCVCIFYSVEKMQTCGVTAVKTWSYIICDFLSQVGLSNEDFGDFLAGSVKYTCHQRVFIVPQSGSLCKIPEGQTE